jgi:hypothetical protein
MNHIDNYNINELKEYYRNLSSFKLWAVKKDLIENCRECEFRQVCVDDRIPEQSINGYWKYDSECNYNPYIAKWKDEDGYISVEEWQSQQQKASAI